MHVGERPTPAGSIGIAVLLLVGSCRPAPPVEAPVDEIRVRPLTVDRTIHGDTRFEWTERILAEHACASWARFSSGRIHLVIVWDYDADRFVELAELPHLVRVPIELIPHRGLEVTAGRVEGNEIRLTPEACPELFPCFAHELGHFAGLEDLDEPGAVMSRRGTGWTFKPADRAECVRVGLCEALP